MVLLCLVIFILNLLEPEIIRWHLSCTSTFITKGCECKCSQIRILPYSNNCIMIYDHFTTISFSELLDLLLLLRLLACYLHFLTYSYSRTCHFCLWYAAYIQFLSAIDLRSSVHLIGSLHLGLYAWASEQMVHIIFSLVWSPC